LLVLGVVDFFLSSLFALSLLLFSVECKKKRPTQK